MQSSLNKRFSYLSFCTSAILFFGNIQVRLKCLKVHLPVQKVTALTHANLLNPGHTFRFYSFYNTTLKSFNLQVPALEERDEDGTWRNHVLHILIFRADNHI